MVCRYQNTKYGSGFRIFYTSIFRNSTFSFDNSDFILFFHSVGSCTSRGIYMASECLSSSNSFCVETLDYFSLWNLALGQCGIISKIKVLHLRIKVYMKNVAVFTHWGKAWNQKELWVWDTAAAGTRGIHSHSNSLQCTIEDGTEWRLRGPAPWW